MTINEKAAYLKGLAEGLGVDDKTNEGKIITELLSLVADMADKIDSQESECEELRAYVEELDEDLGALEEAVYAPEDAGEDETDEEMGDYFEVDCPHCGETVCFDETLDPAELICPACGEKIDLDVCDGECEKCDDAECEARGKFD